MLKKKLLLLLLVFSLKGYAQKKSPEINLAALDYHQIEAEFIARLNSLRAELKLNALENDNILKKAATDQSHYQKEKHFLTHDQKTKGKEKPANRVFFYNGTHDQVGENCIKIPLKRNYKSKYSKKEINVNTYADAGDALFLGWKNSPAHYNNMSDPDYDVYGLGFSFDKDSSYLYCTQVFAAKQFLFGIEMRSPADAYGIKEAPAQACSQFKTQQALNTFKNFQITIAEDSIFIRSEDAGLLKKFFSNPTDGIYFDLVQRKQFVCEKNNLMHGSPVHDGKMLAPVLFKEIFKRNRIKDGKNFYASVCKTPKQIKDGTASLNYGFVRNNFSCEYTFLVSTPESNLRMLDLYPKWVYIPDRVIQTDSFNGNLSFNLPFERGEVNLTEKKTQQLKQKLEIYKPFITHVNLQTYSSVEGNAQMNLKLQEQRASNIMNLVKTYYTDSLSIKTQATENWEEFFALIENTEVDYLSKLPKEKIKEKLRSKSLLDSLDYLLRVNRMARLNIGINAVINNDSDPYLILAAYKKSIEEQDSLKSFNQQNKLLECITKLQFESTDLLPVEIPLTRKFLPHLTNYLAVSIKNEELLYSNYARNLAIQTAKLDENYLPAKFNLCIVALKYMHEFNDTLLKPVELEQKMNACFKLGTPEDSIIVSHMWLNYSILSVYTNWERHLYQNIDKHLANVKKYYPGAQINENEAIELGLLFNMYSRQDWTCELLYPYLKNKSKNEDLLFLFNQTYASYNNGLLTEQEWEKLLKKAKKANPGRFYTWINDENYQLLRKPIIKKEFCELNATR